MCVTNNEILLGKDFFNIGNLYCMNMGIGTGQLVESDSEAEKYNII